MTLVLGTTDMTTIGILIVVFLILTLTGYYENRRLNKKNMSEDAKFRESLPIGMYHADDVSWATFVLGMAGVDKAVELLCSCGYAEDCAMHCNHDRHPDCTGPNYFILNGLDKKPEPTVASQWSGRFLGTQTPDLIKYSPVLDAMIMTKDQLREISKYLNPAKHEQERRGLEQRKAAFQEKIIVRHQARLKELLPESSDQLAMWPRGMI